MSLGVPTRVDHREARHDLPVAVDQMPAHRRQVEVRNEIRDGRPAAEAECVLPALNRHRGVREILEISGMVKVQMRDDHMADVLQTDADRLELTVQAVFGRYHGWVYAVPEEILIHGGKVPGIGRIEARI